jgi:Cu/Ag efflux pump CusA
MTNFRAAAFCSWPMPRRTSQSVGHVRIGDLMPMVPINSVVGDFKDLNNIPIRSRGTQTIFIRVLGSVEDGADIQTGYALVDGHRTVHIPAK